MSGATVPAPTTAARVADVILPDLPRCAWLLDWGAEERAVYRGPWVERSDEMVFEGAWVGDLSAAGALGSPFRCGSGAVLAESSLHLFAPTHSIEAVYCFFFHGSCRLLASNSLAMIAGACPEAGFGPQQAGHVIDRANGIRASYAAYPRVLYETSLGTLHRLAWSTFELDPFAGEVHERPPFPDGPPPFETYEEYRDYLRWTTAETFANASSDARRSPYGRMVALLSSGYDSSACAAVGASVGCHEAVTLTTARGGAADSGVEVARALGLECHEAPREASVLEENKSDALPERHFADDRYTEFLAATVGTGGDLAFQPLGKHLAGTLLLAGFHGDPVWNRGCPSGPGIERVGYGGNGLEEFRKRIGFVHVPVAFIGAQHSETIAAITDSPDMQGFRTLRTYDRPIARRIAEEMGVPRAAFGQNKHAAEVKVIRTPPVYHERFLRLADRYGGALRAQRDAQMLESAPPARPPSPPSPDPDAVRASFSEWRGVDGFRPRPATIGDRAALVAELDRIDAPLAALAHGHRRPAGGRIRRLIRGAPLVARSERAGIESALRRIAALREEVQLSHAGLLEELDSIDEELRSLGEERDRRSSAAPSRSTRGGPAERRSPEHQLETARRRVRRLQRQAGRGRP